MQCNRTNVLINFEISLIRVNSVCVRERTNLQCKKSFFLVNLVNLNQTGLPELPRKRYKEDVSMSETFFLPFTTRRPFSSCPLMHQREEEENGKEGRKGKKYN